MSNKALLLDRVAFERIHIDPVDGKFNISNVFPQIEIGGENVSFSMKGDLFYPDDQLVDPRYFTLFYGVKIDCNDEDDCRYPYKIDIVSAGYFRYEGGEEFSGEDRFMAVRFSGYQILHGAIREMICNLTARGRHGIFSLPSYNFLAVAKAHAKIDEAARQEKISSICSG